MGTDLRRAFGHFVTGVTIITTVTPDGARCGMTANSFASLSLDPPLVLWSIARKSASFDVFRNATHFAIHVLHSGQESLARRFSTGADDRFVDVPCATGPTGVPRLEDFHACFECAMHDVLEGGDHAIIVGRVLECIERPGRPLIFYRGNYFAPAEASQGQD